MPVRAYGDHLVAVALQFARQAATKILKIPSAVCGQCYARHIPQVPTVIAESLIERDWRTTEACRGATKGFGSILFSYLGYVVNKRRKLYCVGDFR
jgi:hypothetical protein